MIRFKPAKFLKNGHLQTMYPAFFAKPVTPKTQLEIFELADGDFLECLWHKKPEVGDKRPIVVLFHGLGGSFHSPYIKRAMNGLGEADYAVVLMQFRGCGEKINRLPRAYHSGDTEDAKAWFIYLQKQYTDNLLFAVGYSLGGNILLKLLGEWGDASPLSAAIAVSTPLELKSSVKRINSGFSKLYQLNMLRVLKKQLLAKYNHHDMENLLYLKKKDIDKIDSFELFDAAYTAPIHGFKNATEYYEKSSSKQFLKDIKTPTLLVHAENDPFMTEEIFPCEEEMSESVTFELYPSGGHVGFVSGSVFKPKYWLESRITDFFATIRAT